MGVVFSTHLYIIVPTHSLGHPLRLSKSDFQTCLSPKTMIIMILIGIFVSFLQMWDLFWHSKSFENKSLAALNCLVVQ